MNYETIICEKKDHVAIIYFNRPEKLNAYNDVLMNELFQYLNEIQYDYDVRCVIITGTGNKAFCSGADIGLEAQSNPHQMRQFALITGACHKKIESFRTPVIMAINGYCLGGGNELILEADYRIASAKAKFGLPEVKLGMVASVSATQKLPKLVGKGQAGRLMYTGENISAEEALRIGLVEEVVPPEELMDSAMNFAQKIALRPPLAVEGIKRALRYGDAFDTEEFIDLKETEDAKEAYAAFLEKRPSGEFHRR